MILTEPRPREMPSATASTVTTISSTTISGIETAMERVCENCEAKIGDSSWLVTLSRPETGAGRGEDGDGLGDRYEWCLDCALTVLTEDRE